MNTEDISDDKSNEIANPITRPISSADLSQNSQTVSSIKKSKTLLRVGICLVMIAAAIIFGLVIIPRTVRPCSIFSSYSHISLCSELSNIGLLCSFFLGIPLNIAGASLILSSITRNIKHKEAATTSGIFIIVTFNIILTLYLLINFIK